MKKLKKKLKEKKLGEDRQRLLFAINVNLDFETCADMPQDEWVKFFDEKNNEYQTELERVKQERLKAEKERKEREAKLKAEKKAREKLEKENKERLEREEKERIEKEKEEKSKLAAPDKEKLLSLSETFKNINLPELKTKEANEINKNIEILINKLCNYIEDKANKL